MHPEDSSICKSAIVDNSMPLSGGIIGLGTYVGIESYKESEEKIYGLEVDSAKKA